MVTNQCQQCQKTFKISESDQELYNRLELPLPTYCPDCRCQRRMAVRNEKHMYPAKCEMCQKDIVSLYSPDKKLTVYCNDCWFTDKWEAQDYAQEYDANQSFFNQFQNLQRSIPRPNVMKAGGNIENSDYCAYIGDAKNCYLVYGSIHVEECYYGNPYYCKNCVDSLLIRDCELCYECVTSEHLYNCLYCQDCFDSNNLVFCYDCKGCTECIGCTNLRNNQYNIFNKQYTKEEYEKEKARINLCNPESYKRVNSNFEKQKIKSIRKYMSGVKNENVTGNYINESKSSHFCFDVKRVDHTNYSSQVIDLKDCLDNNYTEENELCIDYIGSWKNNRCHYSNTCYQCNDVMYSELCYSSKNLFGCVSLKNKEYCILNKQYSPEEYKKLKNKIMEDMKKAGDWGEFFPIKKSIFAYNETVANEYFPEKQETVLSKGWRWHEDKEKEKQLQTCRIPQSIDKIPDSIIHEFLICSQCGENYKIIKAELEFYRQQKLPIPKICNICRHKNRMKLRTPRALWHRQCMCTQKDHSHDGRCSNEFETAYNPNEKEMVYCEDCYNKEIY